MDAPTADLAAAPATPREWDPVIVAAETFRNVLTAMSRPGTVVTLDAPDPAPDGLHQAAYAVLLTLADADTPIWLPPALASDAVRASLAFHTGARVVDAPADAAFAVLDANGLRDALADLPAGTPAYPDRSATAIVGVDSLGNDNGPRLTGPGIERSMRLDLGDSGRTVWPLVADSNARRPLGVDFLFSCGPRLAAIPRSTRIEES